METPEEERSNIREWAQTRKSIDRNEAIKEIRSALKRRSGKSWSVTGGRGTAWGWITIDVPPAQRCYHSVGPGAECKSEGKNSGHMSIAARRELADLLGFEKPVHQQGVSIPSSNDYYQEHIDRANGRPPSVIGKPYWD